MIDTDERVKRAMAALRDRPMLPLQKFSDQVIQIARDVPTVRLGRSAEDQRILLSAKRSRLSFIKLECLRERGELARMRKGLVDHIYVRYGNHLRLMKSEMQRKASVGAAIQPLNNRIASIDVTLELVEVAMNDYDSRGFAFRDIVAANKIGERDI